MDEEAPPPSSEVAEHAMAERHAEMEAHVARVRREGWARTLFLLGLVAVLWFATFTIPIGVYFFAAVGVCWCGWVFYSLMPGPCVVCGKRSPLKMPKDLVYHRPRWWDMRPPRRADYLCACPEHVGALMVQRILGAEAAEKYERWRHELP